MVNNGPSEATQSKLEEAQEDRHPEDALPPGCRVETYYPAARGLGASPSKPRTQSPTGRARSPEAEGRGGLRPHGRLCETGPRLGGPKSRVGSWSKYGSYSGVCSSQCATILGLYHCSSQGLRGSQEEVRGVCRARMSRCPRAFNDP